MDKFNIVKKYIDEMDYYGLLAQGSPEDEFDNESAIIAYQINPDMSPENVAYVISQTFYEAFDGASVAVAVSVAEALQAR